MIRFLSILCVTILLASCSRVMDGSTQEIMIETPGTAGALCFLERPGYRMRVWAPQTIHLTKSGDDLSVHCIAPGNREKTIVVEAEILDSFTLNVLNGVLPGAAVDYETGSMFTYPETVTVDFRGTAPKAMPLPDYQLMLMENPAIMNMEEFRPGESALQRDRHDVTPTLQPRKTDGDVFLEPGTGEGSAPLSETTSESSSSESSGQSTADSLTEQANPSVFGGGTPVISGPNASSGSLSTGSVSTGGNGEGPLIIYPVP